MEICSQQFPYMLLDYPSVTSVFTDPSITQLESYHFTDLNLAKTHYMTI